ncbi:MAG: alpha/beta hydrolase [Bacteroidetes bacterium]|nr:MAG: alpha/beta hydrolase [Bacteroidota bacterium]
MRKKVSITFLVLIPVLLCLSNCVQFRESTGLMLGQFPEAKIDTVIYNERSLRYMSMHRHDTLPTLFFLHGSPSSMSVYNVYYQDKDLANRVNIIAADRPGYGYSGLGMSETSIRRQAEKMWKILEKEGFPSPLYIVGASYGGSVAASMAMLQPEMVDGVVLISASLAPGKEKTYGISYIIQRAPFRWLMPAMIRVANDEKLTHYEALTEIVPYWERIIAPVVMIYGTADRLIFPENADFARRKLVNSPVIEKHPLEGEGHFLQIKYKDFILERLFNLIENGSRYSEQIEKTPEKPEVLSF